VSLARFSLIGAAAHSHQRLQQHNHSGLLSSKVLPYCMCTASVCVHLCCQHARVHRYAAFLHYVHGYHWILRIDADCVLESQGGGWLDGLQPDSKVGIVAHLGMDAWHVILGMHETFVNLSLNLGLPPFPKEWNSPYSNVMAIDVQWAQHHRGLRTAFRTVNETRCVWLNRWVSL
jgi:hypothetical protein